MKLFDELKDQLKTKKVLLIILGSGILAFGLYNIHALSGVTEGGILGMTLLLKHWFGISPAVSGFIMNAICYVIGWRMLGKSFLMYSAIAGGGFSVFYGICEQFPPIYPQIADMPLIAAIVGAIFVGVGVGFCILADGAPTGDDALAMSISRMMKKDIRWAYLITDLTVLALSITYIDIRRLTLSLLTVVISGQIVGFMQKFALKRKDNIIN